MVVVVMVIKMFDEEEDLDDYPSAQVSSLDGLGLP